MMIQLKKGKDGPSTLTCVRADGSRTWNKLHPFFPEHDLTHCATESVLGFTQAFFGLVASGWNIDDFARPGAGRRLPTEAALAESIVGILDQERGTGRILPAPEFNEALSESLRGQGCQPFRSIREDELVRVRSLRLDLLSRWRALPRGETLEVPFPFPAAAPSDPPLP